MSIEAATPFAIVTIYAAFLGLEYTLRRAARPYAHVRGWRGWGVLGLLVSGAANALYPLALVPLLAPVRTFDNTDLGLLGAVPTLVLTTFFTYGSHRLQHRFDVLWRLGHQFHHGQPRVDVSSSMMFHPIDLLFQVGFTLLAATLLGVTADAAALAGIANFALAVFQHLNVPTPHWLGYLVQRPESHVLHHEYEVHARNYGDLPLWDMLFGTFANPRDVTGVRVGFAPESAARVLAMLLCVDVNARGGRDRHA